MVRILHTADWQIGLKAKHVAAVGEAVRKARLEAARTCIEAANREHVDAVVLAGDTFEDNFVDNRLVCELVQILARSRARVYVLPGNHDAFSHESIYRRDSWKDRPEHVVLLESPQPVPVPGTDAVLLPAPLRQKKGFTDPTKDLAPAPDGVVAIGVAHGSLRIEGRCSPDDFPIALDAASRLRLDYLALGHWHGLYVHEGVTAYPGTHETTKFGEEGSGRALLVEIAARGAAPVRREVPIGVLRWETCEIDLTAGTPAAVRKIQDFVAALPHPERTLLRLRMGGTSDDEVGPALRGLEDQLGPQVLHTVIERSDIPDRAAQGRLADIAQSSGLIAGLLKGLDDGAAGESAPAYRRETVQAARRALGGLVKEVWT